MKRIITNGLLIDGTGASPVKGCVAFEDDIITYVGNDIPTDNFDEVIDAKGQVICPGFIDTHSHSDLQVFKDPSLDAKIMQGITTDVLGQDGVSLSPLPKEFISPWRKNLAGLDGDKSDLNWEFETTDNYLKMLESNGSSINLCYLVPHGNVRMVIKGLESGYANDGELKKMQDVLQNELDAGCYGFSTGLIYMPCAYSDTREVTELCKTAAKNGVPFVIHQRSEADTIIESMQEVISVGRDSGVKVHFSHFKLCGKNNAHLFEGVIEQLEKAQKEGITVSFDQYPYVAGSTMLGVILPPWAHDGGTDMLMKRLQSKDDRERMKADIAKGIQGWDNFVAFAGVEGIFVTDVNTKANEKYIGKSLVEIGQLQGKDPLDAAFDLLYEESNAVGMVDFYGLEEHVKTLIARPEHNVCTDGLLGGKPHPRAFGAFPRVLGKYVREEKVISLHSAIRKMTGRPADVFSIKNRGYLKKGYFADIVIFNPDTIIDAGTYENPRQYPIGIEHVIVNGISVVKESKLTKNLPGKVLRKGR